MATSPIYSWPEPDNTDLVRNGALAIRTLGNAIDTTMATMTPKSIVDAKGDLIAATANDTPARLAVGANGTSLVADSGQSTGLAWVATPSASNPFLNSAQNVWQRGTSIAVTTGTTPYTSDRWVAQSNGANNALTVSRQLTSDTTNLPFIQYCARVQRNSGQTGTTVSYFAQSFETVNSIPFAGKPVTITFYARAGANYSPASSILGASLFSGTGTDQSIFGTYTGAASVTGGNFTLTTTWQRFTMTGTVSSSATELAFYVNWSSTGTAGAADFFEITGVQLDVGNVALPYRAYAATFQGELSACQRYYQRANYNDGTTIMSGQAFTATLCGAAMVAFPVQMRIVPTGSVSDVTHFKAVNAAGASFLASSAVTVTTNLNSVGFSLLTVATGLVAGNATTIFSNNANCYIEMSAEL
jgi:hypothetical protein